MLQSCRVAGLNLLGDDWRAGWESSSTAECLLLSEQLCVTPRGLIGEFSSFSQTRILNIISPLDNSLYTHRFTVIIYPSPFMSSPTRTKFPYALQSLLPCLFRPQRAIMEPPLTPGYNKCRDGASALSNNGQSWSIGVAGFILFVTLVTLSRPV
jgi:hypothetical protein